MSARCEIRGAALPTLERMSEPSYRIVPLAPELASSVRETRRDAAGRPILERHDGERHQCRACLELSAADETMLLLSHTPFSSQQPYAETGPVFIHARACAPAAAPLLWPREFPRRDVVLRAYSAADEIVDAELVRDEPVEGVAARLLGAPRVAYLHARNGGYGCYMFRIEKS